VCVLTCVRTLQMSLSNLSVVFAPCLLRYPKGADALTAMTNTVREQTFVLTLLSLPLTDVEPLATDALKKVRIWCACSSRVACV
jgi:hypothetical protein